MINRKCFFACFDYRALVVVFHFLACIAFADEPGLRPRSPSSKIDDLLQSLSPVIPKEGEQVCSLPTYPAKWFARLGERQVISSTSVSDLVAQCELASPCLAVLSLPDDPKSLCPEGMRPSFREVTSVVEWYPELAAIQTARECREGKVGSTPEGNTFCILGREDAGEACVRLRSSLPNFSENEEALRELCVETAKERLWFDQVEIVSGKCIGVCNEAVADTL